MIKRGRSYRVLVLHQVPQQRVALLADVVQVDVGDGVAARVLVLMDGGTYGEIRALAGSAPVLRQDGLNLVFGDGAHLAPGARGRWRPGWGGAAGGAS